jgi:hypothetical protein
LLSDFSSTYGYLNVILDKNSLSLAFTILYVKTEAELFDLMKVTGNEGEYRTASAIKEKLTT